MRRKLLRNNLVQFRRRERIAQDLAVLKKAIAGAPPRDPSDVEMQKLYAKIKKNRKKRRGSIQEYEKELAISCSQPRRKSQRSANEPPFAYSFKKFLTLTQRET